MIVENQLRTSQIVAAYVRKNVVPTDQIAGLINSVHLTLAGLGKDVVKELLLVPAVSVRRSVHAEYIICLECGYNGKMLKRHLQSRHGLSVTEYRSRWKLSFDYPMTAADYSERRSQLAKSIGLGRRPRQSAAMPAPAPETTPEKPARRRSVGKATATRTSAAKASPKKVSAKADAQKASTRTSARKANNGSRSRKPSSRAATKATSVREAATA
jgi:predicted transcriptional regulator